MSTKSKKLLSVVGLGYVGLPLAVEFAKNREVVAFDINTDRVKQLKGFKQYLIKTKKEHHLYHKKK